MGIFYNKTTFKVHRDAQEIPVKAKVDVLVCGGGPARWRAHAPWRQAVAGAG